MLNEIELKNLQTLKGMLEEFKTKRAEAEKGLKEIDDKYKVIIEKEKKELKDMMAACKKEIDFWEKPIVRRYGKSLDELLANPDGASETETEEDSVDELPFAEEEKVVDAEAVEEEPVKEEKRDLDTEEDAEWDEKTASGEIVEVKPENAEEDWETETESKANNDDEWPDFPQEWK